MGSLPPEWIRTILPAGILKSGEKVGSKNNPFIRIYHWKVRKSRNFTKIIHFILSITRNKPVGRIENGLQATGNREDYLFGWQTLLVRDWCAGRIAVGNHKPMLYEPVCIESIQTTNLQGETYELYELPAPELFRKLSVRCVNGQ